MITGKSKLIACPDSMSLADVMIELLKEQDFEDVETEETEAEETEEETFTSEEILTNGIITVVAAIKEKATETLSECTDVDKLADCAHGAFRVLTKLAEVEKDAEHLFEMMDQAEEEGRNADL